jgi:hypothetical protein
MGQLDSNVQSPTIGCCCASCCGAAANVMMRLISPAPFPLASITGHRAVALQVAFERQILKPVFHLIGYTLWV